MRPSGIPWNFNPVLDLGRTLYLSDLYPSVSPPVKQLKRFQGVTLQSGESKTVEFTLDPNDFTFHDRDNQLTVEPGEFKIAIADLEKTISLYKGEK